MWLVLTGLTVLVVLAGGFWVAARGVRQEDVWKSTDAEKRREKAPEQARKEFVLYLTEREEDSNTGNPEGERAYKPPGAPGHWDDVDYCWVVLCKNHWFHLRRNLLFRHRILLGETDAVKGLPPLPERFEVRCDSCGKIYRYKMRDVVRHEEELPAGFEPHPLFR